MEFFKKVRVLKAFLAASVSAPLVFAVLYFQGGKIEQGLILLGWAFGTTLGAAVGYTLSREDIHSPTNSPLLPDYAIKNTPPVYPSDFATNSTPLLSSPPRSLTPSVLGP